jgi:hypothetical protein
MAQRRVVVVLLMGVLAQLVNGGGGGHEVEAQQAGCPKFCADSIGQAVITGCVVRHEVLGPANPDLDCGHVVLDIATSEEVGGAEVTIGMGLSCPGFPNGPVFQCIGASAFILLTSAEYGACLGQFHQEVAAVGCERER